MIERNIPFSVRLLLRLAAALALLTMAVSASASNIGQITQLSATDAPGNGDTVRVSSRVRADNDVQVTNLSYQIIAPDGVTVVATHQTNLGAMKTGDTANDQWSVTNSGFPSMGTYTVTLCWSTGNAKNCNIDYRQTGFYSVPTLGWALSAVALALLAFWLWRRRDEFQLEMA